MDIHIMNMEWQISFKKIIQTYIITSPIFNMAIEYIIIPLFKTGDKNDCGNYGPISLSWFISKIFEKCLKRRLYNFLIKNNFFQSGKLTIDALVQADKYIRENLDNNNKVMGIFFDLKKAFVFSKTIVF